MKKTLIGLALAGVLAFGSIPAAEAASFLSIQVNANPTISCNNSTAAGVTACGLAGFATTLNANTIEFTGLLNGINFAGQGSTSGVQLLGNQPGTALGAFSTDTKSFLNNTTGATATISVGFASNDFSLPQGSPLTLNGGGTVTGTLGPGNGTTFASQDFTASGDGANSLTPGAGVDTSTVNSSVSVNGTTDSDNTSFTSFVRTGNFALSGIEVISLAAGATASFSGTVNATAPIPEPSSVLLLGTGMLILAGRRLRRKK